MANKKFRIKIKVVFGALAALLAAAGLTLALVPRIREARALDALNSLRGSDVVSVKGRVFPVEFEPPVSTERQDVSDYKDLLISLLFPCAKIDDWRGANWPDCSLLCELIFEKADGTCIAVRIIGPYHGPPLFTDNLGYHYCRVSAQLDMGKDSYLDEGLALYGLISAVASHNKSDIAEFVALLNKSAGRNVSGKK